MWGSSGSGDTVTSISFTYFQAESGLMRALNCSLVPVRFRNWSSEIVSDEESYQLARPDPLGAPCCWTYWWFWLPEPPCTEPPHTPTFREFPPLFRTLLHRADCKSQWENAQNQGKTLTSFQRIQPLCSRWWWAPEVCTWWSLPDQIASPPPEIEGTRFLCGRSPEINKQSTDLAPKVHCQRLNL